MRRSFVFIGAPASGKGSFGQAVASRLGLTHFSLGDRIRAEVAAGSAVGRRVQATMEAGQLVDDTTATEIVLQCLQGSDRRGHVILDGFPRTVAQAVALHTNLPDEDFVAVHVVLEKWVAVEKTLGRRVCATCKRGFNVADVRTRGYDMPAILPSPKTCPRWDTCMPKLEARVDDTREVAESRYQEFLEKTTPLLAFYGAKGALRTFNVTKGMADTPLLVDLMTR